MFTSRYMNLDEKSRLYPERGPGRTFPITTPLERTLLIIIAIVVLIGIGLSISIVSIKRAKDRYEKNLISKLKNETNICYSSSCISEASNLLKSLDTTVDPCSDFYAFACGKWMKSAYLVSSLESQFTRLAKINTLRVKGILEDLQKAVNLPEHKSKTRDFYKSCMDKVHRNEVGVTELLADLKKFGGWPLIEEKWDASSFNWSDLVIQLFKNGYVNNMLFSIKLDIDAKNTSRSLITVTQPSLGLKDKFYYTIPDGVLTKFYKKTIFRLAGYLRPRGKTEMGKSMDAIEDAFQLENKIANLMKEINMKYPDEFYNIMTLEELESFAPKIPWRNLLEHMLPPETYVTNEERVMVPVPSMINGLNKILEDMDNKRGKEILSNYMFYRIVFFAASNLNTELYNLVKSIFDKNSVGHYQPWEVCVKTTMDLFSLPLTANYVAKYMKNNTKELLGVMFDDIKSALMKDIEDAKWLDEKTKSYALFKVDKMRATIAYQDEIMEDGKLNSYYDRVNITDDHFGNVKRLVAARLRRGMEGLHESRDRFRWTDVDNLLTANAYYQPNENAIIIPAGVLQDTVFAGERPNYINYGSLGMIVGHELTHAFDSIGSLYDAGGSYRMWWTQRSWKRFEERVKCYEEQYGRFHMPEVDANINGTLTLAENIADNGGLQTAYYAYRSLLKRLGSEKSLPGLPYDERQMFWISFASVWCRKQTEENVEYGLKHSVHAPSRFRIIGSLSNTKEFSEDFNCELNSTMNPETKCFLWK